MGLLADCEAAGFHHGLLLPVIPPTAGWSKRGNSDPNGKAPGRFDMPTGNWLGLDNWQHGCPRDHQRISDDWGCNVGLLLGQVVDGRVFAALDGDLNDDTAGVNHKIRESLVSRLVMAFGMTSMLIRETVRPRFMMLVELDPAGDFGGKQEITWNYRDNRGNLLNLGKLELLTRGEQCVIAGRHISGNVIHWRDSSNLTMEYQVPLLNRAIPKFKNFAAFGDAVMAALKPFERGHFHATMKSARASAIVGASREPIDLAPPDVRTLVELVDRMHNNPDTDYNQYINFWYSLEGCRRSLLALGRSTPEDDMEIVRAGLDWCAKWQPAPPHKVKTRAEEMEQWRYTQQVPLISLGWGYLKLLATQCGVRDIGLEEAQREFVADLGPIPTTKLKKWVDPDPDRRMPVSSIELGYEGDPEGQFDATGNNPRGLVPGFRAGPRKSNVGIDVPLADIQIADHMEMEMSGRMVWLSDERRWLTYEGAAGWKGDDSAASRVEIEIEEALRYYVATWADAAPAADERWTRTERTSALSTRRIDALIKRLATRFSKTRADTDKGKFILQTPNGAVDLRTGAKVDVAVQKSFIDTRCTNYGIRPGETPMFDELITNLSDGNPQVFNWFMHYLGYALMGSPRERVFLFVWGTSGNGKSALVRILSRIFGNYVVVLNKDVLLERGKEMHKTDLYRIRGARIACAVEMPPNEKWDESLLKAITGGDEISARPMRADARSFEVEAALLLVGNNIPAFDRIDQAIAARARVTGTTFQPAKPDPTWEDRLVAQEAEAIVAKLGGYAKVVWENDMKLPEVPEPMARATRLYLGEQDSFYAWVVAELHTGNPYRNHEVPILDLKRRYEAYLRREAEQSEDGMVADAVSDKSFLKMLRSIGLKVESENEGKRLQRVNTIDGKREVEYLVRGCAFKIRAVATS